MKYPLKSNNAFTVLHCPHPCCSFYNKKRWSAESLRAHLHGELIWLQMKAWIQSRRATAYLELYVIVLLYKSFFWFKTTSKSKIKRGRGYIYMDRNWAANNVLAQLSMQTISKSRHIVLSRIKMWGQIKFIFSILIKEIHTSQANPWTDAVTTDKKASSRHGVPKKW